MKEVKCKKCGENISSADKNCPNCGAKQKDYLLLIVIGVIVTIVVAFVVTTNLKKNNEDDYDYDSSSNVEETTEKTKKEKPKELSESEKMTVKLSNMIDEGKAYDAGNYVKGDIEKGEYAFVKFSNSGDYYSEKDAAGNIIDNEIFDSFGYVKVLGVGNLETQGVLVKMDALKELGVSGAKQLYEILNEQENYNQGGYYKVGLDLAPGNYILESLGSSGYYAIMSGPVSSGDIVDNDNFNGKAQVNLRNGQYLELSRAQYTKK